MKTNYLFLALFICCIFAGCRNQTNEVVITGQLEGIEDGTIIKLRKTEGRMFVDILSDTLTNGRFKFTLTDSIHQAVPMAIMADGEGFPPTWLDVWAAPGAKIEISGKDKLIRTWDVKSGISEQQELNKYKSKTKEYERITQSVMREAYSYFDAMRENPENIEDIRKYRAKIDSLYAINDSVNQIIIKTEVDLLAENKTYSTVWMDKLKYYSMLLRFMELPTGYADKMKKLYDDIPEDLKNNETAQSIHLSLYPPAVVKDGDDMADADMWDTEGNMRRLANYKGKYILIDFWSSGCGPCIKAIPEMKEISETYKDRLTVVSISSDTKGIWEKVSKEKDISWVNLNDFKGEDGIKIRYGVNGIPHYVMISPEGKIITSWAGYGKGSLKKKMEELIKS